MRRRFMMLLLPLVATACVNKQSSENGAIRFINAVSDAPRMALLLNGATQASGYDFGSATPYIAPSAGQYQVRIRATLPSAADPPYETLYEANQTLAVNSELSLLVVGQIASSTLEVVPVWTTTRGVPNTEIRVQAAHAAIGVPPIDVYVTAPDAVLAASTPLAANIAYKGVTPQTDITAGNAVITITAAGDPATIYLQTGTLFLPVESTVLLAAVPNPGLDAAEHPVRLVFWTGTGSSLLLDKDTQAYLRAVNASAGTYDLDAFVNQTSVNTTERQACDPQTQETDTILELCGLPFNDIGDYDSIAPGTYNLKFQESGNDAIAAKSFGGSFSRGDQVTVVPYGFIQDSATSVTVGLASFADARRVATSAQLRFLDLSQSASDAVAADPTTDRLELRLTELGSGPLGLCVDSADETVIAAGFGIGFDTGYLQLLEGTYQLTLAITDTADTSAAPQVLLQQKLTLTTDGVFTLLATDSVGGVQPVNLLSVDDDASPEDCPAPP